MVVLLDAGLLPPHKVVVGTYQNDNYSQWGLEHWIRGCCELIIKPSCDFTECFPLCLTTQGESHSLPTKDNFLPSHKTACTYLHTHFIQNLKLKGPLLYQTWSSLLVRVPQISLALISCLSIVFQSILSRKILKTSITSQLSNHQNGFCQDCSIDLSFLTES